jgi:23S rRNA pseudouridine1911/1915/1917 synthase
VNVAPELATEDDEDLAADSQILTISLTPETAGERLDRALAAQATEISRARLQALIAQGRVRRDGQPVTSASARALPGVYEIAIPPPAPAEPEPQDLPLTVLFEDAHLIVVEKPAGMAAHPGPGVPDGTLVNALLHHCGASLVGVGGIARPGIVHRLDKDTSGVLVAAKTDAAHAGLSALFAAHDIERLYVALVRGAPGARKGTVVGRIGRSPHDRKKMALVKSGGREAITHYEMERRFGPEAKPMAARLACRLETGRTHQIRVHMASLGCPVLGDPVYGSGPPAAPVREAIAAAGLERQALHAAVLGFIHPVTGAQLRFESPLPDDMARLQAGLSEL